MVIPLKYEYSQLIKNRRSENVTELSYDSRKSLTQLFRSLIDGEINSESKRKTFTENQSFSTYENFELVKAKFQSYITKFDVSIKVFN
jgi:hypothetical protein